MIVNDYENLDRDARHLWASVSLTDGLVYEGRIINEAPHGVYLSIGDDRDRLTMFPWDKIEKITYKSN